MKQERLTLADFDRINRELMGGHMTPAEVSKAYRQYVERQQKQERAT